ncbi:GNAT family N-acetyltransferase [Kineococcus esterisolvens]|uniref:GNAT family N-acetyltransferase n=1 Tax=unclassified Kineococcus TaxID=2621656 RepID=UPI003D7E43E2
MGAVPQEPGSGASAGGPPRAEPRLRAFDPGSPADLDGLYEVCLRTGFHGEDATGRYADPRLLGDVYAGPYAAHDPALVTVVDDGVGVAGYVIGCADTLGFEQWARVQWWAGVRRRHRELLATGARPTELDTALLRSLDRPAGPRPYLHGRTAHPAHLHIDLLPHVQGRGLGRRLVEHLLVQLGARGVPGVHLGVSLRNPGAVSFYRRLGFRELVEPAPGAEGLTMGLRLR